MSKKNPEKKGIFKEFVEFINKGNALAMAIGVIIGAAFGNIVSAINTKIISPIIAVIIGDNDLSNSLITVLKYKTDVNGNVVIDETTGEMVIANAIYWGAFIQAVIDFLLTAIILFAIVKLVSSLVKRAQAVKAAKEAKEAPAEEPAPAPAEPVVPEDIKLLSEIRDLLKDSKKE